MSEEPTRTGSDDIRPLDVVVSVWVLFVLALAQPLLDLLGRNAEFFLARSAPPLDIILLAVSLTFILPLTLGFLVVGVRRVHEPTRESPPRLASRVSRGLARVAHHRI